MPSILGMSDANEIVVRAVNQATKDWVRHILGECDPQSCDGTHDAHWYARNPQHLDEMNSYGAEVPDAEG